jgi:vanillate O-demethylase monooxygenase subunit
MFLRNCWYVFGWSHDLAEGRGPTGRTIIGEPIVVWRDADGALHALEDRCGHRFAPLSRGRIEGDRLRCMYHGLTFDASGRCVGAPMMDEPPDVSVRSYPVVEQHDWVWVWMGDSGAADVALIPAAHGITDPEKPMRANSIEYQAHYQLVHDNLCDLSHLDFVHATTLRPVSGAFWSESEPRISAKPRAIRFERWFENCAAPNYSDQCVDIWSSYEFAVPGIFVMSGARFPAGAAAACKGQEPIGIEPINRNLEQQAVTPISETRTAYHYATGLVGRTPEATSALASRMGVMIATFEEDRAMIEAQQRIWDLTTEDKPRHFLPQDRGPYLMRQLMRRLIEAEAGESGDSKAGV